MDEATAIRTSLQQILEHESIEEFAAVWDAIGVEGHIRVDRREKMVLYLCNLLTEMLDEEKALKKRIEESIKSCSAELKELEESLKLTNQVDYSSKTMLEKERLIRERLDALNKIKHERIKRLKRLIEMETALCQSIGETTMSKQWQKENSIPSEEDLQNYRKKVEQLESTKDQRQVEFRNIREKARLIWEELETTPTDDLGLKIYHGDISRFVLSNENMTKLNKYYQKLEISANVQEEEAESLRNKLVSLWDRLDIPVDYRDDFLSKHQGYKIWIIDELKSELERLNVLKQSNLETFIEATRTQLHVIWDKCFYGINQKQEFAPAFKDEFTDDSLSAHESELDRMRGFYADNVEIFKLIEKRESLWQQKIDMDIRSNDPGRLNNRGGKLLQEQRLHQKVNKDLPKVEKKLQTILQQWEDDHSRHFIVHDQRYLDNLESRWNDYHLSKEEEKLKRQQMKNETTMLEMKFGSKAQSPTVKRKATGPASNDRMAKMRKIGMSPLVKSATPNKTPARKGTRITQRKKILKEKNGSSTTTPLSSKAPSTESSFHEFSLASAGSYNEFQNGLIIGIENDKAARSSAVPRASTRLHNY